MPFTHIIVERIVLDIDEIVKKVRFSDWQHEPRGTARSEGAAAHAAQVSVAHGPGII
jgi:hypothetical protein